MSEAAPIFILGLQRGGTNQLLNVLRSHPDAVWPDGEFHQALRPNKSIGGSPARLIRQALGYLPVYLRSGDIVNPHKAPPAELSEKDAAWIGRVLERETRRNAPEVTRYKAAMVEHGFHRPDHASADRMVVKLVNYNVGLAEDLRRLYPNARFVGIMREAVGVCESMVSRGMPAERVLPLYAYVAQKLVDLRDAGFPLMIVKFEDIIADIAATSRAVYAFCGLDGGAVTGLCLQDKTRTHDASGKVVGFDKVDLFYDFESAGTHLRRDVNASARARIGKDLERQIDEVCGPVMERLGYGRPAAQDWAGA